MPIYRVVVREVLLHEFHVEAPDRTAMEALFSDAFADACSDHSGFLAVEDRDITSITEDAEFRGAVDLTLDADGEVL